MISAFQNFAPAADGEAVRSLEAGRAMEQVQTALAAMAAIPQDEGALLALAQDKKTVKTKTRGGGASENKDKNAGARAGDTPGEADKTAASGAMEKPSVLLPAALLPSRDIAAAQDAAARQIALLEGRQAWIEVRGAEMKSAMALVAAYQEEKIALVMASVSQAQEKATGLMAKVTTLRLFTGEDIDGRQLVDGESADPAEPLVFMQRLLYLDEELFVHGLDEEAGLDLSDGFNADHFDALPKILASHPEIVTRMAPFPRCVVLAKIRRTRREHGALSEKLSTAVRQVFQSIAEDAADARILVLVRDGGKLHAVLADEQTSRAERLFPSHAEIQALFSRRTWRGETASSITADDIDYTDARAAHDARALHYKRFLIMFWGLHEREGVFGPFMPSGVNWLLASTHDDRFRFIHDEEGALEDGRGKIADWIALRNSGVGPGSRVVGQWRRAADSGRAPSLRKRGPQETDTILAQPAADATVETVRMDAGDLVVDVPAFKERWSHKASAFSQHRFRARFMLTRTADEHMSCWDYTMPEETLCLDTVTAADLDIWIARREARSSYARWIVGFAEARKLLRAEESRLRALLDTARDTTGVTWEDFLQASLVWRRTKRWSMPKTAREIAAIVAIARALDMARTEIGTHPTTDPGGDWVSVDEKARIVRWAPTDAKDQGFPVSSPWVKERGENQDPHLVFAPKNPRAYAGCVRAPEAWDDWRNSLLQDTPEGLRTPQDALDLARIGDVKTIERLTALLRGDRDELASLLEETFALAHEISTRHVQIPTIEAALALGVAAEDGDSTENGAGKSAGNPTPGWMKRRREQPVAFVLGVKGCPLEAAVRAGLADKVLTLAKGLYARPEVALERAVKGAAKRPVLQIGWTGALKPGGLKTWRRDSMLVEHGSLRRLGAAAGEAAGGAELLDGLDGVARARRQIEIAVLDKWRWLKKVDVSLRIRPDVADVLNRLD